MRGPDGAKAMVSRPHPPTLLPKGEGEEETEPMSITPKPPQIIPYLFYRDVPAALDFLCVAFGFKEEMRHGTPSGGMHGEASFQGQRVMLGQGGGEHGLTTPKAAGGATM